MARDDSILHCFRLNINNPDQLKIHKILRDLDTSVYKSKSNFIIGILKNYLIDGDNTVPLSDSDVAQQGGYVTKEYVDNLKADIRKELEAEIRQELFNMVISAMSGAVPSTKPIEIVPLKPLFINRISLIVLSFKSMISFAF